MQNNKEKQGENTIQTVEETMKLTYFFVKKRRTSAWLSLTAYLAAFFGKLLIKFKKSTRDTAVAFIHEPTPAVTLLG